jgi:spore coat polysaccharide biosynthesis protein SpsF
VASVLIGIQARSGSTRLPRKAFELIGNKPMLLHVIDAARSAVRYLGRERRLSPVVDAAVLTPYDDPIAEGFWRYCDIKQGPEHDVLTRYHEAGRRHDFIVRLTGDCPLIPDYLIVKMIKSALVNNYDYVSNVDPRFRTAMDGHDCEVVSRRMLDHLHAAATREDDREHVTTLARRDPPEWASKGFVINYHDHSALKYSVDTPEDLARVRAEYDERETKRLAAERYFGKTAVHRL